MQDYQHFGMQNVGIQKDFSSTGVTRNPKTSYLNFMGKVLVDFDEEGDKSDVQHDERLIELNVVIRVLRKRPNVGTFDRFYHFDFVII